MINFNVDDLIKKLNNTQKYTLGYVDGLKQSEGVLSQKLAELAKNSMESYIDAMASMNPQELHHVYEWGQVGAASARLFVLTINKKGNRRVINSSFTQSTVPAGESDTPFYNKAQVMESGQDVLITPRSGSVLRFYDGGEEVFTSAPVYVQNPGGVQTTGGFEETTREFFDIYFSQSVLTSVGFWKDLKRNSEFKRGVRSGGYNNGYKAAKKTVAKVPGGERIGI